MDLKEKIGRVLMPRMFERRDKEAADLKKLQEEQQRQAAEQQRLQQERKEEEERQKRLKDFVFKKGGVVRGDGVAKRGRTRGRFI